MTERLRWTFRVGHRQDAGRVTVWAPDYESAVDRARAELDRRCDRRGEEPPVAWDLTLHHHPTEKTP